MKTIKYALPFALMFTAGTAMAADLDGAKLFNDKTCASCHGEGGDKPIAGTYPKLGGQNAEYTLARLKAYKAGEISGGQAAVMTPMANMLSEEEMEAIANYLAEATCTPEES